MARLNINRPEPVQPPPPEYVLTLTEREASELRWLLGSLHNLENNPVMNGLYETLVHDTANGTSESFTTLGGERAFVRLSKEIHQ